MIYLDKHHCWIKCIYVDIERSDTTIKIIIFCSPDLKYPFWRRRNHPWNEDLKILIGGYRLYHFFCILYNDIRQYEPKYWTMRNNPLLTKLNQHNYENVSPNLSTIINHMLSIASVPLLDLLCKYIWRHKQVPFV